VLSLLVYQLMELLHEKTVYII
ncbi:uncharacterized protein METZ01_LOCUS91756, partial [marine metagenome]